MARTDNFQKFVKQKKGSAIKEEIRQDKKKVKKERAEAIEKHFAKKRAERLQKQQSPEAFGKKNTSTNKGSRKTFNRPSGKKEVNTSGKKEVNTFGKKEVNTSGSKEGYLSKRKDLMPSQSKGPDSSERKEVNTSGRKEVNAAGRKEVNTSGRNEVDPAERKEANRFAGKEVNTAGRKEVNPLPRKQVNTSARKEVNTSARKEVDPLARKEVNTPGRKDVNTFRNRQWVSSEKKDNTSTSETMQLNKFIAHGGICSRRDAAVLVKEGKVTVNGAIVTDPGSKVSIEDVVKVGGKKIIPSRNFVYILLNKPKDYITTVEDPEGRKTVLDLVKQATTERVYPVGRLDRNTSGVLLLTNDGDLAQKLSHPKHEVKKVYEVKLDRALTKGDMDKIASGVTLEDGFVAPDVIAYADAKDKSIIGIEIHSGRNRIVRRIFEHMKYDVKGLDRVMFAGLTKKNVQRGNWRLLNDKEIRLLKFMNQSFVKVKA